MRRGNQSGIGRCKFTYCFYYRLNVIFWYKIASDTVLHHFIYSRDIIRNHRYSSFVCFDCGQTKSFFVACDEEVFCVIQYGNNFLLAKFPMKQYRVLQPILSYQCLQHCIGGHILCISNDIEFPARILLIQCMEYFNCMMHLFVGYNSADNRQDIPLSNNFCKRNKWHICRIGNDRDVGKSAFT